MEACAMTNGLSPVDYTTDVGLVRVLIPDVVEDAATNYLFSDDQVTALLGIFSGNVLRAAAQAKDIIATDQVLLLKVVRTDDLTVDGAKVAAELRLEAKALRDQADVVDGLAVSDYFDIVYPQGDIYPEAVPVQYGRQVTGFAPWVRND